MLITDEKYNKEPFKSCCLFAHLFACAENPIFATLQKTLLFNFHKSINFILLFINASIVFLILFKSNDFAKSLPDPVGIIPKLALFLATIGAMLLTCPSPPHATIVLPFNEDLYAISFALLELIDSITSTFMDFSSNLEHIILINLLPLPLPALGLTIIVSFYCVFIKFIKFST